MDSVGEGSGVAATHPQSLGVPEARLSPRLLPAGVVRAIAAAAGKEARIVHYDPAALGLGKGEGFPFR
jgi:hypothetical protein